MQGYQYKVVPFIGSVKGGQPAANVSMQLEALIQGYAKEGWELAQVADVNIEVKPGCLAGMFGADVSYQRYDQVIFRRPA